LLVNLLCIVDQPLQQRRWRVAEVLIEFVEDNLGVRPEGRRPAFRRKHDHHGAARPHLLEAPFGEGFPDLDAGPFTVERPDVSTVAIRGYIDRVDVSRDGEQLTLTLYDYQTGRAPYMTKTTGGIILTDINK